MAPTSALRTLPTHARRFDSARFSWTRSTTADGLFFSCRDARGVFGCQFRIPHLRAAKAAVPDRKKIGLYYPTDIGGDTAVAEFPELGSGYWVDLLVGLLPEPLRTRIRRRLPAPESQQYLLAVGHHDRDAIVHDLLLVPEVREWALPTLVLSRRERCPYTPDRMRWPSSDPPPLLLHLAARGFESRLPYGIVAVAPESRGFWIVDRFDYCEEIDVGQPGAKAALDADLLETNRELLAVLRENFSLSPGTPGKNAGEMLDTKSAAAYLNVSPGTLTNWRSSRMRRVPYVKIGRRVLYKKSDLDQYIKEHGRES